VTELLYRGPNQREFKRRETDEDWADVCNRARAHLFPEVTAAEIAAQSMKLDAILNADKVKKSTRKLSAKK